MKFWDDPIIAAALAEPDTDVLGELQARTEAAMARLHDERGPLIVIDEQAADDWIASRDAEYDVEAA